jgi:hypothetical protein
LQFLKYEKLFTKTQKMKKLKIFSIIFAAVLLFSACKKTNVVAEDPKSHSNTSGSFELIQKTILTKSCAVSGCHASISDNSYKQHKLVLKGTDLYKNLINGLVTNTKAQEAGLKQIIPKDPAKSFLYQKMNFNASFYKFGNAMPLGADALTANQLKFINDWIAAGAPEIGHVANEELLH